MKDPVGILGYWRGFQFRDRLAAASSRFPSAPERPIGTAVGFNLRNIRG
jgi:hypothetical protein